MIQKTLRLSAIAAASFFAIGAAHAAGATLNVDANVEQDNDYNEFKVTGADKVSGISQGGRVEVNFTGKATNGDAFVAGKGTLILGKSSSDGVTVYNTATPPVRSTGTVSSNRAGVDDMWVQFGTSAADLKLGRFEGIDMWPVGRDTPRLRGAGDSYRGQLLRGRVGGSTFHGEGTVNIAPGMAFVLGLVEQKDAEDSAVGLSVLGTAVGLKGIRPAFTFSTGGFGVKVAIESGKWGLADDPTTAADETTRKGFTGVVATGNMALAGGSLNLNVATAKFKEVAKSTTIGVNYTMDLGPWALVEIGDVKPEGGGTKVKITTLGVGYQLSLLGVKGATVTPALSVSQAKVGSVKSTDTDLRVRFNYAFNAF